MSLDDIVKKMDEIVAKLESVAVAAVKGGHIDVLERLLDMNVIHTDDERYFDYDLVMLALINDKVDCAKLLVDTGFRVYKPSKSIKVKTVLYAAVLLLSEDIEFITSLLAKGASLDILSLDEKNLTPFHLVICCNRLSTVTLFLSQLDAKDFDEKYLLHYAIENNNVQVVKQLIAKGLSMTIRNQENLTPFCIALEKKNFDILDILLSNYKFANIDPNDHDAIVPAYVSIIHGSQKLIKKYVDSGLPINIPMKFSTNIWPCLENSLFESGFTLLHFAVKLVKLKLVELLLRIGSDIFVLNENGSSPLHIAFEAKENGIWKTWQEFQDNNSIIDIILKANTKYESNPVNKYGQSHFHIACSIDEPAIVEHFLNLGIPVNQIVSLECYLYKEFSPLHFAAKFRCKKTMDLLLKNGADVKQIDFNKMTALHIAAKESCLDTVKLLLQYGSDITAVDFQGNTPIHLAFEKKNYKIIDLLLLVPNVTDSNLTNNEGLSHFHIACTRNNTKLVKSFIDNKAFLVPDIQNTFVPMQFKDWSGYSPLHFAVSHNKSKVVQLLINSGANVGIKDNDGMTPLHLACKHSNEMFAEFIENTLYDLMKLKKVSVRKSHHLTDVVTVNEKHASIHRTSFLQIYYWLPNRKEHLKIINLLLNCNEIDINSIDNHGNTAIFYACAAVNTMKDCMSKNNPDCEEKFWDDIIKDLSRELCERKKIIFNTLVTLDINLNNCYKNGSILHYICSNYDDASNELLELFLKQGINVNVKNEEMISPIIQATKIHKKKLISLLLDYGADINCTDPQDNSTPLLIAASKAHLEAHPFDGGNILGMLIVRGANVNARLSNGRTALHIILLSLKKSFYFSSQVSALVDAGADINSQDSQGLTPLHIVCERREDKVAEILLHFGADVNVEDKEGRSVVCYFYEKHLKDLRVEDIDDKTESTMEVLQKHTTRIDTIGLPVSEKVLLVKYEFDKIQRLDEDIEEDLSEKCESDLQLLRSKNIHSNCSLYDVIFKDENALSQLTKNPTFKSIVKAEPYVDTFPIYGYLLQLKYRAGVYRSNLLPKAKFLLDKLAGMHLPDICSENICKYFNNVELKETIENLWVALDFNVECSNVVTTTSSKIPKRPKYK